MFLPFVNYFLPGCCSIANSIYKLPHELAGNLRLTKLGNIVKMSGSGTYLLEVKLRQTCVKTDKLSDPLEFFLIFLLFTYLLALF